MLTLLDIEQDKNKHALSSFYLKKKNTNSNKNNNIINTDEIQFEL